MQPSVSSSISSRTALLVLVLTLINVLSAQAQCTYSTCPEGPVKAYFSSTDCSGAPSFLPFTTANYSECNIDIAYGTTFMYEMGENGVSHITFGNDPTCTMSNPATSYNAKEYVYYACQPVSRDETFPSSIMALPSVNASYTSPQPSTENPNNPMLQGVLEMYQCESLTNCTHNGREPQYWYTRHNTQCDPLYSVGSYNVSYAGDICYHSGQDYLTFDCIDINTTSTKYYSGFGCENVYLIETKREVCSSQSQTSTHCKVPPPASPVMTPEPSPTASGPSPSPSLSQPSPTAATPTGSAPPKHVPTSLFILAAIAMLF